MFYRIYYIAIILYPKKAKLDHNKNYVIGAPGFGRDADDFVEKGMVYCMGGTGMIFSNAIIRNIRPYLKTCVSNLMTEHEDVEIGRCFFRYTGTNCNTAFDSGTLFFQNWAKNVKPGGVGYKSDIDPNNDLTNQTIDTAIIMHAVKVSALLTILKLS